MAKKIFVINARGEKEPFSFKKAYHSARRVGASRALAQKIAETVRVEIYPEIKTALIFKRIKELLHQELPQAALRFSLKEAMRKLGPGGYVFEKYLQKIFARNGFRVEEKEFTQGRCTRHEIDLLAQRIGPSPPAFPFQNEKVFYIGECKYRNRPGSRADLEVGLAHYARFLDIKEGDLGQRKKKEGFQLKPILMTNTKFTSQVVEYAVCRDVELWGWKYPVGQGLERLIDSQKLYPITILPSLEEHFTNLFLEKNIILAEELQVADPQKLIEETGLSPQMIENLLREVRLALD